jgi:hypothetical protein
MFGLIRILNELDWRGPAEILRDDLEANVRRKAEKIIAERRKIMKQRRMLHDAFIRRIGPAVLGLNTEEEITARLDTITPVAKEVPNEP